VAKRSQRLARFADAFLPGVDFRSPALAFSSFTGSSAAFAAATLALDAPKDATPFVLAVVPGLPDADVLADDLHVLENECAVRVLEFPPALEGDPAATSARLKTAAVLSAYRMRPYPLVVVASVPALLQKVPVAAAVAAAVVRLDVAQPAATPFSSLAARLSAAGYVRVSEVTSAGTFAVRGGVLDVWPPDEEAPLRAEFFGEELESLRTFDPGLQTSVAKRAVAEIPPVEMDGRVPSKTLLEVLPDGATVVWFEHASYTPPALPPHAHDPASRHYYTGDPAPGGVPTAPFVSSPLPGFAELGGDAARHPELLDGVRERLSTYLKQAKKRGALVSEDDELSAGFETDGLCVVAKSDRTPARRTARRMPLRQSAAGERLDSIAELDVGDYVVHIDHGIGRFAGSTEIEIDGKRTEVFTLEYADGGKLHVPVSHAHLLSRYVGVKGEKVKLHRLDGKRWVKEKADAQRAVRDLAAALLDTQARRAVVPGFAYTVDQDEVARFEEAFPWEETPDQAQAIANVKRDLASPKPMDRLVCGDAGYGKTEVAMRAAFIAAMNGKQTAFLAPTTVLAEQHFETFLARFEGTPVRVEPLSRFQSPAARKATCDRLRSGATDVVVGTHALLSSGVTFRDLGLVVIDEEQRFGVRDKEHLKQLRATADVLTMSATPIPRTLYLSMTGARDLSVLRTPPRERVAVETKIVRDTDAAVKAAIERELARGGQVYYLYNRVTTIARTEQRLRRLFPDARIDIAHGQMPSVELAERMRRFARGLTDILVCTTIVESGLDIPRANTILVDRADRFGLAELYQLRGRVGRSARAGYAYFLLPVEGLVDADARERLDAIRKHAGLGAGFDLALRDLELRGAGNLLGKEQSGHLAAVGFQLYCQLLQRTVAALKGEEVPQLVDVVVDLDFVDFSPGTGDPEAGACLPYDYVEDEAQRVAFHRRLAETATAKDVAKLKSELADRFGRLPPAAARLVRLAELRVACAEKGVTRITAKNGRAIFYRGTSRDPIRVLPLSGSDATRKINCLFRLLETAAGA